MFRIGQGGDVIAVLKRLHRVRWLRATGSTAVWCGPQVLD